MQQKSCQIQNCSQKKIHQKNSQFTELGGFGIRFCQDLFTELIFDWDATSSTFGCMTDGDEACKLFFLREWFKSIKKCVKSIKAQVADDLDKIA